METLQHFYDQLGLGKFLLILFQAASLIVIIAMVIYLFIGKVRNWYYQKWKRRSRFHSYSHKHGKSL